jgi:methylmalonyl-CoA mutase
LYHKDNEFEIESPEIIVSSENESYFDKVNNPADNYIETLTAQLAEKALVLFKDIEANGF